MCDNDDVDGADALAVESRVARVAGADDGEGRAFAGNAGGDSAAEPVAAVAGGGDQGFDVFARHLRDDHVVVVQRSVLASWGLVGVVEPRRGQPLTGPPSSASQSPGAQGTEPRGQPRTNATGLGSWKV